MSELKPTIEIDGSKFASLDEFFSHFSEQALNSSQRGMNLDAFNDVLRGGFGSPNGGFRLVWKNHELSKTQLGYAETVRQLEKRLTRCHPVHRDKVRQEIEYAGASIGPTVFDWLVEIISVHCEGGEEAEDGIELVLA